MQTQLYRLHAPMVQAPSSAICKTVATPAEDPPWQPHPSMPGYKIRYFRNGRMQIAAPKSEPATVVARKDPPYCQPDWGGFQYHGADGKAGEVVRPATWIGVDIGAANGDMTAVHAVASDDWQSGAPPVAGWYEVDPEYQFSKSICSAYWFGGGWSAARFGKSLPGARSGDLAAGIVSVVRGWRGPRLTGKDWPEPEAKAEEVPSVGAVERAYIAAHSRNWRVALSALQAMQWAGDELSPAECAAAIAAFNAIPAA